MVRKQGAGLVLALLAVSVLVSACGAGGGGGDAGYLPIATGEAAPGAAFDDAGADVAELDDYELAVDQAEPTTGGGESVSVSGTSSAQRKIITTVDLRMETTQYDECAARIYAAIAACGGYVEYSDITGDISPVPVPEATSLAAGGFTALLDAEPDFYVQGYVSGERRHMFLRIRVPQTDLPGFMSQLESFGNVLGKQESAEDITLSYVDIQSRLKALQTEQERLLDMLERAETVEDMILLEERLSFVRYQLESYESQLRVYDNQVSYATVNLTLNEVILYTEKPVESPTVGQRISAGLKGTFGDIAEFWTNGFVWLVVNLVYIVTALAALFVVYRLLRRFWRPLRARVAAAGKLLGAGGSDDGWTPPDAGAGGDGGGADAKKNG